MLKKLTEPYVIGVASRVVGQAISFVTIIIVARFLDLEGFGIYAFAWALAVISNTFVFTGFYQALLRTARFEQDANTLFWLKLAVGALGGAIIVLVGFAQGGTASEAGRAVLLLAPLPVLIVPVAWWEAQLVRAKRVRAASIYNAASELVALVALYLMLKNGQGVEALVLSRYVAVVAGVLQTGALVWRLPRLEFRRETLRDASKTAFPLWGTTAVGQFSNYGTDLILGAFASPALVGAYRAGARIAITASDLVLQPLNLIAWSRFTRVEKEGEGLAGLRRAWTENMGIAAALLWPLAVGVALLAPELILIVLDESWLAAAGIVAILSVSRAIGLFNALLEPAMVTTDNGGRQLVIRAIGAVTLLAGLLLFGRHGPTEAAYVHLASSALTSGMALLATAQALRISLRDMVACFAPGALLAAMTYGVVAGVRFQFANLSDGLTLLAASLGGIVVCGGLIVVFLKRRVLVLPAP